MSSKAETPNRLIHEGLTLAQLKEKGISVSEIRLHARLGEDFIKHEHFKQVGYTAQEMKEGGFSWIEIKAAGYEGSELVDFVKTPEEIYNLALFKDKGGYKAEDLRAFHVKDLKAAGFTAQDFKAGKIYI